MGSLTEEQSHVYPPFFLLAAVNCLFVDTRRDDHIHCQDHEGRGSRNNTDRHKEVDLPQGRDVILIYMNCTCL